MRLNQIYGTFKDDVEFLCVYVREAHPDDGWRVPENLEQNIRFNEPTTDDERTQVAHVCQLTLDLKMPMVIDGIDNPVEEYFKAMPMRLFLLDREGVVVYTGETGPFGFDPDSWEEAIKASVSS